jgi:Putative peptidoglycan binding domain
MLPTVKNTAISAVTALSLALGLAAPAKAWDQREQDVLKGVVGTVVLGTVLRDYGILPPRNRPVYQQQPVYQPPVYQPPRAVYTQPRYYEEPVYQPRQTYSTSVYRTAAAQAFNSYSLSERRAIQRRLAAQGYYYGGIDGSFGPGTYNAVAAYAADLGQSQRLASRDGAFGLYDGLIF